MPNYTRRSCCDSFSDGGSIPPISTILVRKTPSLTRGSFLFFTLIRPYARSVCVFLTFFIWLDSAHYSAGYFRIYSLFLRSFSESFGPSPDVVRIYTSFKMRHLRKMAVFAVVSAQHTVSDFGFIFELFVRMSKRKRG